MNQEKAYDYSGCPNTPPPEDSQFQSSDSQNASSAPTVSYEMHAITHQPESTLKQSKIIFEHTFIAQPPDSYFRLAFFTCVCCFWPLGILAMYQAYQVESALHRQDLEKAKKSSRNVKRTIALTIATGIVLYLGLFGLLIYLNYEYDT